MAIPLSTAFRASLLKPARLLAAGKALARRSTIASIREGQNWENVMSVAKVIELSSSSSESFEKAIKQGLARASRTLKNIEGAWIKEQQVSVKDGAVTGYRVNMMVTFVLEDEVDA